MEDAIWIYDYDSMKNEKRLLEYFEKNTKGGVTCMNFNTKDKTALVKVNKCSDITEIINRKHGKFKAEHCDKVLWKVQTKINEKYHKSISSISGDDKKILDIQGLPARKFVIKKSVQLLKILQTQLSEHLKLARGERGGKTEQGKSMSSLEVFDPITAEIVPWLPFFYPTSENEIKSLMSKPPPVVVNRDGKWVVTGFSIDEMVDFESSLFEMLRNPVATGVTTGVKNEKTTVLPVAARYDTPDSKEAVPKDVHKEGTKTSVNGTHSGMPNGDKTFHKDSGLKMSPPSTSPETTTPTMKTKTEEATSMTATTTTRTRETPSTMTEESNIGKTKSEIIGSTKGRKADNKDPRPNSTESSRDAGAGKTDNLDESPSATSESASSPVLKDTKQGKKNDSREGTHKIGKVGSTKEITARKADSKDPQSNGAESLKDGGAGKIKSSDDSPSTASHFASSPVSKENIKGRSKKNDSDASTDVPDTKKVGDDSTSKSGVLRKRGDKRRSSSKTTDDTTTTSPSTTGTKEKSKDAENSQTKREKVDSVAEAPVDSDSNIDIVKCLQTLRLSKVIAKGIRLSVYKGDITVEKVDAIVNAADEWMQHKGGVAYAIAKAGGPQIQKESDKYVKKHGGLPVGRACYTSAGKLPCKHIIHAVGPRWSRHKSGQLEAMALLHQTVLDIFHVASKELNAKSVAIPAISSGTFGMPLGVCAKVFNNAVKESTGSKTSIKDIRIVLFDDQATTDFILEFGSVTSDNVPPDLQASHATDTGKSDTTRRKKSPKPTSSSASGTTKPTSTKSPTPAAATTNIATLLAKKGDCDICTEDGVSLQSMNCCKNTMCETCFDRHFSNDAKCPFCTAIVLQKKGNQPEHGRMKHEYDMTQDLPGYEGQGMIIISYSFKDGVQRENHPNPGEPYSGTRRVAFLPANNEGLEVLALLTEAFEKRLVFTIGRSVTTGRDNCVVWNDIHHKTNIYGGAGGYGYPDDTYLSRVKEELAAKGIKSTKPRR